MKGMTEKQVQELMDYLDKRIEKKESERLENRDHVIRGILETEIMELTRVRLKVKEILEQGNEPKKDKKGLDLDWVGKE